MDTAEKVSTVFLVVVLFVLLAVLTDLSLSSSQAAQINRACIRAGYDSGGRVIFNWGPPTCTKTVTLSDAILEGD